MANSDDDLIPYTAFNPPTIPTFVGCLHCQQEYESYLIEWRVKTCHDGKRRGFWSCPMPGCDGVGFGCDILPCDFDWTDEEGNKIWIKDDEDEERFPQVQYVIGIGGFWTYDLGCTTHEIPCHSSHNRVDILYSVAHDRMH